MNKGYLTTDYVNSGDISIVSLVAGGGWTCTVGSYPWPPTEKWIFRLCVRWPGLLFKAAVVLVSRYRGESRDGAIPLACGMLETLDDITMLDVRATLEAPGCKVEFSLYACVGCGRSLCSSFFNRSARSFLSSPTSQNVSTSPLPWATIKLYHYIHCYIHILTNGWLVRLQTPKQTLTVTNLFSIFLFSPLAMINSGHILLNPDIQNITQHLTQHFYITLPRAWLTYRLLWARSTTARVKWTPYHTTSACRVRYTAHL